MPATRGRWRTAFTTVIIALVALIGISRLLLGVHYLSDVLGAWAIGITWLGLTAFAFELSRHAAGQPVTGTGHARDWNRRRGLISKPAEPQTADHTHGKPAPVASPPPSADVPGS